MSNLLLRNLSLSESPACIFSNMFQRNEFRVSFQMETSWRHDFVSERQMELSENSPRVLVSPCTVQSSLTSCRCKYWHAIPTMDGICHPSESWLCVRVCVDECGIGWTIFTLYSLLLFLICYFYWTTHIIRSHLSDVRLHTRTHLESPLTRNGDISWNYGDSSRRCICHGCNVSLILLWLLDVTISFA